MSNTVSPILALQQQKLLLEIEYNCEKVAFRKQTETMGLERKVKRGDCCYPMVFQRSYYNSLNQLVVEVIRNGELEIEHKCEFGRPVCFFSIGEKEKINYFNFTGTVSYVDKDKFVVIVPDSSAVMSVQSAEHLGMQLFFDETSYKLMFDALQRVMSAKGNRLAELRDLFYSNAKAGKFVFNPLRFPWLNKTQEKAVNEVLWAKDVAVVHGPPGTGKTTTLVEAIYETLRRESQVLVCAQSNMAVDWISERLVDRGINVLRIGNPSRVNDKMLSFTYERRFESHPDYPQLWSIRKAIREMRANRKAREHQKLERLKDRATELEIKIKTELFSEARVIASTLTGSANYILDRQKFGTLFIDEAAQAMEAACWIAIQKADRVILAGDHCQLPPTVKSLAALKGGLDKTLMERIVGNKPEVVTLLKVQYRMNDTIMRFSSNYFYHGEVESAPEIKYRGILDYDTPMVWIDTAEMDFKEEFVGENFGRINKSEAKLTLKVLQEYFDKIKKERILEERLDVGVISPYRAQVQYLRRLFTQEDYFKPFRKSISVNTVDGFQGQERDIILISLVRANEDGQIGFLRDLRRMNVAITRARMKVIILGDASTMTKHPFYKQLFDYIKGLNSNMPLENNG